MHGASWFGRTGAPRRFRDRIDAGRKLAAALERFRADRPVVMGLPRGGVPVAAEVARALEAPLDVLVVRKVGAPSQPEYAVGAVAEGVLHLDQSSIRILGVSPEEIDRIVVVETRELERRERTYRQGRSAIDVQGRTVIVVDDGLATGASARAAIESLWRRRPAKVVFAAPVGARDSVARLREVATDVVCPEAPAEFRAVSLWYDDFQPTSDLEVIDLLDAAAARCGRESHPGPGAPP